MFRPTRLAPIALLSSLLLLSACATPPPPARVTLDEHDARGAFVRGCSRKGPTDAASVEQRRTFCECSWHVVRRHMSVEEIATLGIRSKESGRPPMDDPKFRAAVADMQECRPR